jgi:hypothetical protein
MMKHKFIILNQKQVSVYEMVSQMFTGKDKIQDPKICWKFMDE